MMKLPRLVLALATTASACVSNPTPHPALDATTDTYRGEDTNNIATPTEQSDCEGVGGFWDGTACYESDGPDAGRLDVTSPEATDGKVDDGDGVQTDGSDAGPDGSAGGAGGSPDHGANGASGGR